MHKHIFILVDFSIRTFANVRFCLLSSIAENFTYVNLCNIFTICKFHISPKISKFDKNKHFRNRAQELAKTDLEKFLTTKGGSGANGAQFKIFAQQMVSALDALSHYNIIHYDVKPSNILLFRFDCRFAKLADFGLAQ